MQLFQKEKLKQLLHIEKLTWLFQNEKIRQLFQNEKLRRLFHPEHLNRFVKKANIGKLFKPGTFLGVDISDRSIEFVEAMGFENSPQVIRKGRIVLPAGFIERGIIKDRAGLFKAITELFSNNGIKNRSNTVFFGLPESQLYTHTFSTELDKGGDYDEIVDKEIKSIVPLDSFIPIFVSSAKKINDTTVQITTVSSERAIISDWFLFFKELGFSKVFASSETLASFEGLSLKEESFPVCVVDIGTVITNCGFFDANGLQFSFSVNVGGDTITKIISDSEKISLEDAEKKKNTMSLSAIDPKIFEVLKKFCFDKITSSIKEAASFCVRKKGFTVKSLAVIGGVSEIQGIADHIQKYTYLDIVEPGGSFKRGTDDFLFIEAIGLAKIGLKSKEKQIVISSDDFLKNEKKAGIENSESKKGTTEVSLDGKQKNSFTGNENNEEAEEEDDSVKARKQLIILGVIVFGGLFFIGGSYFYNANQDRILKEQKTLESKKKNMIETQVVEITVPIAVQSGDYASDRTKGRVVEDLVTTAKNSTEAKNVSFSKMNKGITKPEALFGEPARMVLKKETAQTTYALTWLVYDEDAVNTLITGKINTALVKVKDTIPYKIDTIEKTNLASTTNANVYILKTKTTVRSSDPITITIPR